MDRPALTAATLMLAASLSAQALTVTLDSGGGALAATAGAQTQSTPIPAGPLGPVGALSASAGSGVNSGWASLAWTGFAAETRHEIVLMTDSYVAGSGSAALAPLDVVVWVSYPTPVTIALDAIALRTNPVGAVTPTLRVDVFDDGSFELNEGGPSTLATVVQIGPSPTPIRCQLGQQLTAPGASSATLELQFRPSDTFVQTLAGGCSGVPYFVEPRFDGGLEFGTANPFGGSMFAVFGLQSQPVYLGNYAWPNSPVVLPCSLLPSPDLVAFLAPTSFVQTLPIPAAARPITLFSQGVWIAPGAITTTDTHWISAF